MKSKLQVMKFGGMSVGDAACIARAAQIVAQAADGDSVVTVVYCNQSREQETRVAPGTASAPDIINREHS